MMMMTDKNMKGVSENVSDLHRIHQGTNITVVSLLYTKWPSYAA